MGIALENYQYTVPPTDDYVNLSEPPSSSTTTPPPIPAAPAAGTGTKKAGTKAKKPLDPTEVRIAIEHGND
jgi:hypothetical protein